MGIKGISSSFCSLAGSIGLLMFAGNVLAASVDTKAPAKMTSAPVPTVKAPVVSVPAPTIQPKVKIQTPTQSIQPKTSVKVPPPSINRPQPKQVHQAPVKPMVTIQTPTHKVQTLDPRYVPKMAPAPSATTPRPGQNPIAPVATPTRSPDATTNALAGSKIDSQTLGRIQGIQEAATAAQVFKQLEELKNAKDLQNIGAAERGFGGDQAGPLGDGGIGFGAISGEGSNGPGSPGNRPVMGAIDRSSSADPAEGSRFGAPGRIDESRTEWVSTGKKGGDSGSNSGSNHWDIGSQTGPPEPSGTDNSSTIMTRGEHGTTTVTVTSNSDGTTTVDTDTSMANGDYHDSSVTTDAGGRVTSKSTTQNIGGRETRTRRVGRQGATNPNENYDNKQYNDCVKGAGGCAKKTRTKPMDTITQPSKGDADADPGSSPIIGAAAVTNEDEFHSGGGGGGGGGVNNIDILTQPPTEGAEGGGGIPPAPSGASLEEALGDAALH